jgi:thiamine-phosphate pyrophosphorylase
LAPPAHLRALAPPLFRLLALSDRASLGEERLAAWIRQLTAAGVDGLQIREKDLDDRALYGLARLARSLFPPPGRLLINGRLDIALAAGADGAHLPADGVPVAALRRRFGPWPGRARGPGDRAAGGAQTRPSGSDTLRVQAVCAPSSPDPQDPGPGLLLGVSTHRVEEVERAREAGADYVVFGPVYPTASKERYGAPPGLAGLARAAALGIPVYALGGVTLERLGEIAATGAAGAAGIRLFQDVSRLPELVEAAAVAFDRVARATDLARTLESTDIETPGDAVRREL